MLLYEDDSYKIRKAIFEVYSCLGPGLLENIYEEALCLELQSMGFVVERQLEVMPHYKGVPLKTNYRIDILVDNKIIIELKSVEEVKPVHKKQVLTYLRIANKRLGLLVNFNTDNIKKSIYRIVN